MAFDLLAQYLNGQNAGASPMAPQGPAVTPTPMPTPSPIPMGVPEVYPSGTPGALASNEAIGNPYAAGLMGGGPPPPAMKPRSMAAPQPQSLHVDEPAPESTKVAPEPDELDQYKVTPDDLQDANRQRMAAKMISGLGNIFANQQSAGNYYLHQMAPKTDVTDFSDLAGQGVRDKQALYKQAYDSRANKQKLQEGDQKTQAAQMQMAQAKSFEDPNSTDSKYGKLLLARMNSEHKLGLADGDIASMNARQVGQFLGSPGVTDIVASDKQAKQFAQQMAIEDKKLESTRTMMGAKISQTDQRLHTKNLNDMTDGNFKNLLSTSNNLQNAIVNYEKGGATPQEFNELQQAVRSNAGIKGAGGVGEREETYLKSVGINVDKFKQFITGNPQSVMESDPEFSKQILGLAKMEIQNKRNQASKYLDMKSAGQKPFYDAHPDLATAYENQRKAALDQFGSDGGASKAGGVHEKLGIDPAKLNEQQKKDLKNQARLELIQRQRMAGQ